MTKEKNGNAEHLHMVVTWSGNHHAMDNDTITMRGFSSHEAHKNAGDAEILTIKEDQRKKTEYWTICMVGTRSGNHHDEDVQFT